MDERDLCGLIDRVKAGGLSRRGFVCRLAAVGLTAPMAHRLLAFSGVAMAQSKSVYKPAQVELDPLKRAAMLIKLNELVVNNQVVIPRLARLSAVGAINGLVAEISDWDNNTCDLANWYREG